MSLPAISTRTWRRARSSWRDQWARAQIAASRARRAARVRAVAAGLLQREVAIFQCRRGADVSGLFSEFAAVVGFLDHYDRCCDRYAGLHVDFSEGLYYDAGGGAELVGLLLRAD